MSLFPRNLWVIKIDSIKNELLKEKNLHIRIRKKIKK